MKRGDYDAIILGAGAAGMLCAARAGRRGRRVLLVEHYHRLGEKIRISGGGRCNFTNIHAGPANYLSQDPDFCKPALAAFGARDFIALVRQHGIAYHEKKLGQLFCDGSATEIIAMLRAECDRARVDWSMPATIDGVTRAHDVFGVRTSQGVVRGRALVIATGGLSVPKIGATPLGYRLAEQFGLRIVPPRPGLVPLAFHPEFLARYGDLAGVSVDAEVRCGGGGFRENLLFTHRGLSGPAILQVSSYWSGGMALHIDLLPGRDARAWLATEARGNATLVNVLARSLPRRFAQRWCAESEANVPLCALTSARRDAIAASLADWQVTPAGTLGYQKAEVTVGGIDTRDLVPETMAARHVPGLYCIGEVIDVTGWLGGYNFQWAWSSAVAAGDAL